jgi:hypothetical protein
MTQQQAPQQQRSKKWLKTMSRRTMQAVAAAAFLVSANAFSTPATTRATMMLSTNNEQAPTRVSSSLSMIDQAEKVTEYELQVGRALDTLRSDYPDMLLRSPSKSLRIDYRYKGAF